MACSSDRKPLLTNNSNSEVIETPENKCINLLLLGTSGNGKSASGNSITLQSSLKTSDNVKSVGKRIEKCSSEFEDFVITVVEAPGNQLDEHSLKCFKEFQELIEEAFQVISTGFTAIVLVLKYGNRFTEQECRMIKWIEGIFGEDIVRNSLICLLTHGDFFEYDTEDEEKARAFVSWCKQQDGKIKPIFQECNYRCVLFNNKTKDPIEAKEQVKSLLDLTRKTKMYTYDNYKSAGKYRQKLEDEIRAPAIQKEAENKLNGFREILATLESTEESSPQEKVEEIEKLLSEVDDLEKRKGLTERSRSMSKMFRLEIMSKRKLIQSEARSQSLKGENKITHFKRSRSENNKHRLASKGSTDSDEFESPLTQSNHDNETVENDNRTCIHLLLLETDRSSYSKSEVKKIILGQSSVDHILRSQKDVEKCSTQIEMLTINVYDFPDLYTGKSFEEDLEMFRNYIKEAFRMCEDGFSALILVLKYNGRRSNIDQHKLKLVRKTFGPNVLRNNVICVITSGDTFEKDYMGELTLDDWCRGQKGELKKLFQECQYRCILFSDSFKHQVGLAEQVKPLLALTKKVQIFTKNHLKDADEERKKSIQNKLTDRGRAIQFLYNVLSDVLNSYTDDIDDQRNQINILIQDVKDREYQYSTDPIIRENDLIKKLVDVKRKLEGRSKRSDSRHGVEFKRNTPIRESTNSAMYNVSDEDSNRLILNRPTNNREKANASELTNKTCCSCHIL